MKKPTSKRPAAAKRSTKKPAIQAEESVTAARQPSADLNPDGTPRMLYAGAIGRREAKDDALEAHRDRAAGTTLTTDQGIPVPHTDDTLKAGARGPTLIEDFHFREKLMRFDHERIPERVVHARGSGAHGYFQVYESLEEWTCADFLCDPMARTPVFVRFSTVVGSRGSADTVRDARGFATKFYTRQGNFDLVGNNIPVFFIQDGIKFPDLVHAIKPEPHHEMPQASSAHDTFWDFVSLVPETLHMVMWVMSDRGIPRSYRMMEGFGVHTFRLVNAAGKAVFCKFHWKPLLGIHSLVWDEAQKIAGKDPDFHRRDLWEAIECGDYPEFELGLQIIPEEDELAFGFDLLDATKVVPEEIVPVRRVGKLTLDRNPDNFFAETEQVAFCIGNVVPGIDFSNDPLLHARLFSYLDTQLTRLGGPNFAEIPINRPLAPVHNHQQDGFHRQTVNTARAMYHPNSIELNRPVLSPGFPAGFEHVRERLQGFKVRERAETFLDFYSQARLFLASQTPVERTHLVNACRFEIAKVQRLAIRERVLGHFQKIDPAFAAEVAAGVGVRAVPLIEVEEQARNPRAKNDGRLPEASAALSIEGSPHSPRTSIKTRKVAVLLADGARASDFEAVRDVLFAGGAKVCAIAPALGAVATVEGRPIDAKETFLTAASVLFDAVYVCGGDESAATLVAIPSAIEFVREAYQHAKPIGATNEGIDLLARAGIFGSEPTAQAQGLVESAEPGVVTARGEDLTEFTAALVAAIREHRHWDRGSEPGGRHAPSPHRTGKKSGAGRTKEGRR